MVQKDPVCGMMIDERRHSIYREVNGQKVYLCSAACKSQLDQNPDKYGIKYNNNIYNSLTVM